MKGFVENMGWIFIEMVMLVLFIYVLFQITSSLLNPDEQIVLANTELLRASMNEACMKKKTVELDNFNFPQQKPTKMFGISDILPRTFTNMFGDPEYVLYYEAFPAGEAVSWETYIELYYRVIAPVHLMMDGKDVTGKLTLPIVKYAEHVEGWKAQVLDAFRADDKDAKVDVFVNNIILSDNLGVDPTNIETDNIDKRLMPSFGNWESGRYFAFTSYHTLSKLEKTLIKYRPCDENALCLKTKDGVYTFPLDQCKDIKYVQLVYDGRVAEPTTGSVIKYAIGTALLAAANYFGLPVPGGTAIVVSLDVAAASKVLKEMYGYTTSYKVSDFYIASPCKTGNVKIAYTEDCTDTNDPVMKEINNREYPCNKMASYPIYSYNYESSKFGEAGDVYTCIDSIVANGEDKAVAKDLETPNSRVPCLKVYITKKEDFCWTTNPVIADHDSIWDIFKQPKDVLTSILDGIGGHPVGMSAEYLSVDENNAIVLKPSDYSGSLLSKLVGVLSEKGLMAAAQRSWGWGWPGGGIA